MKTTLNRRDFVKRSAALSATSLLVNPSAVFAAGNETIKIGLVGCGSRGRGSLYDCIRAARHLNVNVEIVALGDYFKSRTLEAAERYNVPEERCFDGADNYRKVIDSDADVIFLVTPPIFRPLHFEKAIQAGKHVFMEKPIAVDAPGARRIMKAGELAAEKNLTVISGMQRRHEASYRKTAWAVQNGGIGRIMSGKVWWCRGQLWFREREEGESDANYMVRNWTSFNEMSGDHIVEQHMHNIDVANWFIGRPPQSALGFGGRARRQTGNQFDFFSVDFDYGDDVHIHSMCRQVNGCYNRVAEYFVGTEGATWGTGPGPAGYAKSLQIPDFEEHEHPRVTKCINMLNSIMKGESLNETRDVSESTLAAIMGRISAYSGQLVRFRELTDENARSPWYSHALSPTAEDFEKGTVTAPPDDVVPIPGRA